MAKSKTKDEEVEETEASSFVPSPYDVSDYLNTRNGGGGDQLHRVSDLFEHPNPEVHAPVAQGFSPVEPVAVDIIPGTESYDGPMGGERPVANTDQSDYFHTRDEGAQANFDPVDHMPGGRDAVAAAEAIASGEALASSDAAAGTANADDQGSEAAAEAVSALGFDPADYHVDQLVPEIEKGDYGVEELGQLRTAEAAGQSRVTLLAAIDKAIEAEHMKVADEANAGSGQ